MNKQDLIDHCKTLQEDKNRFINCIDVDRIINTIKQLDEPEKVKIPQMVAEWLKKCKTFKHFAVSLSFALHPSVWEANGLSGECIEWLTDAENQDTFARAWLDGYEVEEEKRCYIRLKGVDENYNFLNFIKHLNAWVLAEIKTDKKFRTTHTRKELEEAGFGWVFDCPGIEIEEVEDE